MGKGKISKCKLASFISGLIPKHTRKRLNRSYCLSGHDATSSRVRRESQITEMGYQKIMEMAKGMAKKASSSTPLSHV